MTEAEKDLLNRLCDVVVAILTKQQTQVFADSNGNYANGWDLAKILIARKQDANPKEQDNAT